MSCCAARTRSIQDIATQCGNDENQDQVKASDDGDDEEDVHLPVENPITHEGQVCYERILPSEQHYFERPHTDDDIEPSPSDPDLMPLHAVGFINKIWRKKDLNVYFLQIHRQEAQIMEWASEWSKYSAIQFHKIDTPVGSDIRVNFNQRGSWSYIGTDATQIPIESFTMNLGFVDKATVLHEFGHALGLIHEHQSPFRGGYEWDKEAVIRALSGPPNYWDRERIENNIFKRYKKRSLRGTRYDTRSIMHYSFPPEWIKGKDGSKPRGIGRNMELSDCDKKQIRRLYGPPRNQPQHAPEPETVTVPLAVKSPKPKPLTSRPAVTRVIPHVVTERTKPVTELPVPSSSVIYDVHVFEPHRGELSGPGAELLIRFHTSPEIKQHYTILTHGETDMIVALLGPDDYTKFITASDDDAGDGKNAKIVCRLSPDRDYFLQIQTFHPEGGKFEFSITSW